MTWAGPVQGAVTLVRDGEAAAVVVTADDPTPTAVYAAEELVAHVEQATGATLPTVTESAVPSGDASRVYVGVTAAAAAQGIDADALGPDVFVLRTRGSDLYVLGREDASADPLAERNNPYGGTLFGVYELLENHVGVRWLWPGELGTFVPRTDTLVIPETDQTVEPALRFRRYRTSMIGRNVRSYDSREKRLAFTEQGLHDYARDLNIFHRRRRMGDSEPKPPVGHYFSHWWRVHGEANPEWFMMRADGERGPGPDDHPGHVAMCVSNPDLHNHLIDEDWDGGPFLRLGEVDRRVFCQCPDCLAWDAPRPEDPPEFARVLYEPQVVTDRYARFWRTMLGRAAERNPDVTVTTFLYWNYLPAPVQETELDPRIYGEFVPWAARGATWYPMTEEADRWLRDQWLAWKATGITMGYRPNHTLAGYAMPHINTWQGGEFLRFAYEHGMVGVDFDSLVGQWAVRGPEHYMYYRLFADPTAQIADIRAEYFSAFGPAAELVEQYFDYWENHNNDLLAEGRWHNIYSNPAATPDLYPPEVFPPAVEILDQALAVAAEDPLPEFAERVRFLQIGLEHARRCVKFIELLESPLPPRDSEAFEAARQQVADLVAFRRQHEHLYIADYVRLASRHFGVNRRYRDKLDALFD